MHRQPQTGSRLRRPGRLLALSLLLALAGLPPRTAPGQETARRTVVCLGDSLTAGPGLTLPQTWPSFLQHKLDEEGLPYRVINAGVSGDTTAAGLRRVDWVLRHRVDVLILALGANDGLRGLPLDEMERNLQGIIDKARASNADVRILLAGIEVPPNMGADHARRFREVFPRVAARNRIPLWPFLLDGVANRPDLNMEDGLHPNEAGHRIIAERAWPHLRPLLEATGVSPLPIP